MEIEGVSSTVSTAQIILSFSLQECTIAELNYQVDEMLFKINALAGTANLPEKPHIQTVFTDSDTTYGSGGPDLDNNLFLDGIKNVEFWNHG